MLREGSAFLDIQRELADIVGPEHVLIAEDERWWASADALNAYRAYGRLPAAGSPNVMAVVRPGGTAEVAEVLRWASRRGVAVIPRGGGTGVMGAAVALGPAVALDLSRLDDITVHREDMMIEAGAGALLADVARAAEQAGLLFAHDPWSQAIATVGGALNTNGMGYLYGRYGTFGDQVLGLEGVLADGEVFTVRPSVAGRGGPLLDRLFAGSEGAFAVVTRVVLRAWPLPEARVFLSYRFPTFAAGFRMISELFLTGVVPAVLDMSDSGQEGVDGLAGGEGGREITHLNLAFFGFAEEVDAAVRRCRRIAMAHGAEDLGEEPALAYWNKRHAIADEYTRDIQGPRNWRRRRDGFREFDYLNIALPASRVLAYRQEALDYLARCSAVRAGETGLWGRPEIFSLLLYPVSAVSGGLAGSGGAADQSPKADGRLPGVDHRRLDLEVGARNATEDVAREMQKAMDYLLRLAHRHGGTMEAIHGPGLKLAHLMEEEWGAGLRVLERVRSALDPARVLTRARGWWAWFRRD